MSHNPTFETYRYTEDKKKLAKIEGSINEAVRHHTYFEGGGGLVTPIRWMSRRVFGSYQEAYDWLNETDSGWYDNRAVVYVEKDQRHLPSRTKKQEMIGKRLQEARQKYTELSSTDRKSTRLNSSHNVASRMPSSA